MYGVVYNSDGVVFNPNNEVFSYVTFDTITGVTTFTTGTTQLLLPIGTQLEVLVVAGGGMGGGLGGGGGAGGVVYNSNYTTTNFITTIQVGRGGGTEPLIWGWPYGEDSIFGTITAEGGGAGGNRIDSAYRAQDGGSGGGAWKVPAGSPNEAGGLGTAGQGYDGGMASGSTDARFPAGGGGGAAEIGKDGRGVPDTFEHQTFWYNGDGGNGLYYGVEFGDEYGDNGYFGGGGGGYWANIGASGGPKGGLGGGGKFWNSSTNPESIGQTNTGGGGAGGLAVGGSGIVIIKPI